MDSHHESVSQTFSFFQGSETSRDFSTWYESSAGPTPSAPTDLDALGDHSIEELFEIYETLSLLHRVWPQDPSGQHIGPYELVREIGRGGMGTVWEAIQNEPIHRRLAIKFIHSEALNPKLIQRFNDERQLLANMNHANIARIVDAGETDTGQLYYVMELVAGRDLIAHCNENNLNIEQRLQIFLTVCDAIQHAHQKGIIHRDIKPSNVLVGLDHDHPVAKVIDFGLAKLLENEDSLAGLKSAPTLDNHHSQAGVAIGSLWYMSPEHTGRTDESVDIRSDVFSLGVLLFELLTGQVWLDKQEFSTASEVLDAICSRNAESPSQSILKLGKPDRQQLETQLRSSFSSIQRKLESDLDWIVLKALQQEPSQRYASVSELKSDIKRFLDNRAVEAHPKSVAYEYRKLVQRNPLATLTMVGLAALTFTSLVLLCWGLVRASNAEKIATTRLDQTRKSSQILADVFTDLNVDAIENANRPLKVLIAERLVQASNNIRSLDDKESSIELQNRLAGTLNSLGFFEEAITICEEAYQEATREFGMSSELTRNTGETYSKALALAGQFRQADEILKPILDYCVAEFGWLAPETLRLQFVQAKQLAEGFETEKAKELFQQVIAGMETTHGPDDFRTQQAMFGLATVYLIEREGEQVIPLLTRYYDSCQRSLRPGHPKIIEALYSLAWAYCQIPAQHKEALKPAKLAYDTAKREFGDQHPLVFEAQIFVAISEFVQGRTPDAIKTIRSVSDSCSRTLGDQHPKTLASRRVLARFLNDSGQAGDATEILDLIRGEMQNMDVKQAVAIDTLTELATSFTKVGEFEKARQTLKTCLQTPEKIDHQQRWVLTNEMAENYFEEQRFEEAVVWFRKAYDGANRDLDPASFFVTIATVDLAKGLGCDQKTGHAIQLLETYQEEIENLPGVNRVQKMIVAAQLGIVLAQHGDAERGVPLMESIANSPIRLREWNYLVRELRKGYAQLNQPEKIRESIEQQLDMMPDFRNKPGLIYKAGFVLNLGIDMLKLRQNELASELLTQSQELYATHQPDSWEFWYASLLVEASKIDGESEWDWETLRKASEAVGSTLSARTPLDFTRAQWAIQEIGWRLNQSQSEYATSWTEVESTFPGLAD